MSTRVNIVANTKWASMVGYSRAVRVGDVVEVSGTAAVDGRKIVAPGDAYEQTKFILGKAKAALEAAGAKLKHVVRTRIFVTDITQWEEIGRAHHEYFGEVMPATTMVEVKGFIHPDLVVEIEVSAIVHE